MAKISPEARERIIKAAETLVSEGIAEPTNEQVLEKMGSGSLAYVSPVMREWKRARKEQLESALEVPNEVRATIERSGAMIWAMAKNTANEEIARIKEKHNLQNAELEAELAQAYGNLEKTETEKTGLISENQDLKSKLEAQQQELANIKLEAQKQEGATEFLKKEHAEQKDKIRNLEEKNSQKDAEIRQLAEKLAAATAKVEVLEKLNKK